MAQRYEITEAVSKTVGSSPVLQVGSGVSVTVKDLQGNNLTVYQAETGSSTFSNPLTTDAQGRIEGWVEAPDFDCVVAADTPYTQKVRLSPVGVVVPQSYGAKGDDSTDDTTAISAAITAAAGKTLVGVPGKTYIVQPSTLTALASGTRLNLNGATLKMKASTASGAGIFYILTCADGATDIEIFGGTFHGNRSNGNHGTSENIDGLHLPSPQRLKVHHCRFTNFRSEGIYVSKTTQPTDVEISDCTFDDVGKKEGGDSGLTRQAIALIAGSQVRIVNNRFYDVGSWGVDLEANAGTQLFDNVVVANNVFDTCVDGAVNIAPTVDGNATNIVISDNVLTGASVLFANVRANGAQVLGNIAVNCTGKTLRLVGACTNVVIAGNTFKTSGTGSGNADVYLDSGSTRCVVVGNTLLNTGGAAAIKEEASCDNNVFQANQISNATRYVTTGANTETDNTLRRTLTIAPSSGGALLTLTGSSGTVTSTTGTLNLNSAAGSQMIFGKAGTEDGRFNSSGHFVMATGRQVQASTSGAGIITEHVAAATPTGGTSGHVKVGNGKIWVNDAGTWKSVAVA